MPADIVEPLRCSANVAFLFRGLPLGAALAAASAAGFRTVELLDPYGHPAEWIRDELASLGMRVDLLNAPMGDFAAGDRGFAGNPRNRAAFDRSLDMTAAYANVLKPAKINVLAGRAIAGTPLQAQLQCLRDNLSAAADRLNGPGVQVVTELINPLDTPGFLLADLDTVRGLLDDLGGRVGFQLDVFHLQRSGGNLIPSIRAMAPYTAHVQVADAPDRTEPGSGELNVANILAVVREVGYAGLVGLEYLPTGKGDPFGWMAAANCVPA